MSDKFLNTGGGTSLSNGTVDAYLAGLTIANLKASMPLKTNSINTLVSTKLDITDISNLESRLNDAGGITNPYDGDFKATDFETEDYFSLNAEIQKVDNLTASTQAPDITNIIGLTKTTELATDRIYDSGQATFIDLDGSDIAISANAFTVNGDNLSDQILSLETKTQNITATSGVTSISGEIHNGLIKDISESTSITLGEENIDFSNTGNINLFPQGNANIFPQGNINLFSQGAVQATGTSFTFGGNPVLTTPDIDGLNTKTQNITATPGVTAMTGRIDTGIKVAIGESAGETGQDSYTIALGYHAGLTSQSSYSVAIGSLAGRNTQAVYSVAIGPYAAVDNQQAYSVAVGRSAAQVSQGTGSVALGYQAGFISQGNNSVAIGFAAGRSNQPSNSIVLNADPAYTGGFNVPTTGFFVRPIIARAAQNPMYYNSGTGEITYVNSSIRFKTNVMDLQQDTSKIYDLQPREYNYIRTSTVANPGPPEQEVEPEFDPVTSIGFIAEEVNEIDPQMSVENDDGPVNIDWHVVTTYLVAELKKLNERVKILEANTAGRVHTYPTGNPFGAVK